MHQCPFCKPVAGETNCDHLALMYEEGVLEFCGSLERSAALLVQVLQDWVRLTRCSAPLKWSNSVPTPPKLYEPDYLLSAGAIMGRGETIDALRSAIGTDDPSVDEDSFGDWWNETLDLEEIYRDIFDSMAILGDALSTTTGGPVTMYDPDDSEDSDDIPCMSFGSACYWLEDAERVGELALDFLEQQALTLTKQWSQPRS